MMLDNTIGRQRGAVLLVALIMLLLVTLLAVSGFNMTQTNLKVVQNMESRNLAKYAANAAIEEAISSVQFLSSPGSVFQENCEESNRKCYDFDGDGRKDVAVKMDTPSCVIVLPIKNSELDADNASDASCFIQGQLNSMCVNTVWEMRATATDAVTGAEITVLQGVAVRATSNNVATACPDE
ncbi:hypothetical protein E8E95_28670 [Pseudomonas sp. BN414]|uniref:PilX N-terminal domain-containing pilus assembly protein n=1 Tax=Pseudomonas sp. BN414 TaxID=2567888 RepID=UPI002455BDDC|nr:PilX N-terminal domain-containing pilus assembly protein [Pseudomonas sp. BN414]MDH4570672.1 hypothetical protein [Pseudomonas sp. BN414]